MIDKNKQRELNQSIHSDGTIDFHKWRKNANIRNVPQHRSNNIDFNKFKKNVFKNIAPRDEIPTARYLRNMGRADYFGQKHNNAKAHNYTRSADKVLKTMTAQDKTQAHNLYVHAGNKLSELGKHANMYLHHAHNIHSQIEHYTLHRSRRDYFQSIGNSKKVQSYNKSLNKDAKYMSSSLKKRMDKRFAGLFRSDINTLGRNATKYLHNQSYHKSYSRNFLKRTMKGQQHNFHKPQHYFSNNVKSNKKSYQPQEHIKKQTPKKTVKKQQQEIKQAKQSRGRQLPF